MFSQKIFCQVFTSAELLKSWSMLTQDLKVSQILNDYFSCTMLFTALIIYFNLRFEIT